MGSAFGKAIILASGLERTIEGTKRELAEQIWEQVLALPGGIPDIDGKAA
jgi:hypothetical protein